MEGYVREIKYNEVYKLRECLEELSNYHNKVAVNFKGIYPRRSCDETLEMFYDSLYKGNSEIAVEENGSAIIGFCKINIEGNSGKLDYLFVSEKYRGNNYGRNL